MKISSIALAMTTAMTALLNSPVRAATVSWIGGNGDWNTAANWTNSMLPGPGDDVVIDRPGDVTITHSSGAHTVKSVQSQEAFVVSGGSFTVTAGVSQLSGDFCMRGGAILQVAGSMTSLTVLSATNIDTGGLNVSGGGMLTLLGLRSYRAGTICVDTRWTITGPGSALALPGLTNLVGGACGNLVIEASNGGIITAN